MTPIVWYGGLCKWYVEGLKPPFFASSDKQFSSYDWSIPLNSFISNLWLVLKQSTINSLEINKKFKIYSKRMFFLEPNYHELYSSSKHKFFILYRVDPAECYTWTVSGPATFKMAEGPSMPQNPTLYPNKTLSK